MGLKGLERLRIDQIHTANSLRVYRKQSPINGLLGSLLIDGNHSTTYIVWGDYDPDSFNWPNEPGAPGQPSITGETNGKIMSKAPLWAFAGDETFPSPEGGIELYD